MGDDRHGAIWDMDGTLVDTAELHFLAWAAATAEYGRPFSREDFAATFGQRNPEIIGYLFGSQLSKEDVVRLAERKEELYREGARRGVELLPGTQRMLEELQQAGFMQAIGSSAPRANLDLILEVTGISGFFRAIVSSEDTQRGKPDPQVFLIAAERLGRDPSQCVVFEDAVAGIQAAHAGGMKSIAIRFVGHHPEEKLRQAGANRIVTSLEELSAQDVQSLWG